MEYAHLKDVIIHHTHHLEKLSQEIPGSFGIETIHDLRVTFKKLRAFRRLLQAGAESHSIPVMPVSLTNMYRVAGEVRDLQLFQEISELKQLRDLGKLPEFHITLNNSYFSAKESLVKAIEKVNWQKMLEKLNARLTDYLKEPTIRNFIHRKIAAVRIIILILESDADLHSTRKHLKDIIYNIRIFQNEWGIPFPVVAWKSEKSLNDIATALGDYNDSGMAISLLRTLAGDRLPKDELNIIQDIVIRWETERAISKKELIMKIQQLHLISTFR